MFQFFEAYNEGDLLWLGNWSPTWLAVLAVVGLAVIGISAYDLRSMSPGRRWTLVGLRGAVYGIAVVLLLEPAVDLKHVSTVENDVAVLVDGSRTMSLQTGTDSTRYDRVREALGPLDRSFESRDSKHDFKYFRFDASTRSTSAGSLETDQPDGSASDLTGALRQLADDYETGGLGGVVVLSDGIDTGGIGARSERGAPLDEQTKSLLDELDAPVNTFGAASDENLKDAAIADVDHDEFAFVHNKTSVEVEIQAVGLDEQEVPVTLRRRDEVLEKETIDVQPDQRRYEVEFEYVPNSTGKEIYSVSVPNFSGEALHQNNVAHFLQNVIRDKIRVLQVVGRPSWDERFLRRHLKKNPNVDLISFFILRTNSSVQVVPPDELSLIPFPTRELFEQELGSFDLVVFQNFNFGPYNMDRYLDSIAQYVRDGGGFAMVGGNLSFASGGYAGTPIEDILPVELPRSQMPEQLLDTRPFRPELADAGGRHPITQLAFDPQSNREIWGKLPQWQGSNVVGPAKSDATVLARHPMIERGGKGMPVITVSEKGEGRSMAVTSDSTWRWAFQSLGQGGTPREYQMFWNSAIRWLIKDPELKLINVTIPEEVYTPGESVRGDIRISEPDYTPATGMEGRAELSYEPFERSGGPDESETRTVESTEFETDSSGQHTVRLDSDKPGIYRVEARADTEAGELVDSDVALAIPDVEEYRDIVPRDELLEKLADASGGSHAMLPDADPDDLRFEPSSRVEVNRRKVIHLWDSVGLFGLVLVLLGAEWTLRRRWGRL